MTTINTSEDVLALLRENREFREAARQLILTEELLALPAVFSGFASEMRGDVKRLEGRQEHLEEGQGRLEERQERLEISVDSLRGTALEQKLSTRLLPLVGREFDVRRVFPIWSPGVIHMSGSTEAFHVRIEQALEEGVIDDDDDTRLRVTDLIIRSQRKADRSTLWFTVEASGTINDDDITRSRHSADVVNRIYGQDALPIVYGYRIQEGQVKLAQELGVQIYIDPEGNR